MNNELRASTIAKGRSVIRIEGKALADLEARIGEQFAQAVELVLASRGRAVVTGVGKSGLIARKIVATLNSTGTPAMFLHPTDAVHGDLGMVRREDVVICLSKSGDTPELRTLLPMFQRIGVPIIALVGNLRSSLARASAVALDASVAEEACPHDLAPTASTTATLALGDALAVALLERRQFSREDFAMFHPGGVLGRRLLLRVDEMMATGDDVPRVPPDVPLKDAIMEMTTKRLGCTCVVGPDGRLAGIITDGDLRRLLQKSQNVASVTAGSVMTPNPKTIPQGTLAVVALQEMESFNITQVVVVDAAHHPVGVLHLHELVKAGIAPEENG
jgi:arabinose-5-phosphate isomerase